MTVLVVLVVLVLVLSGVAAPLPPVRAVMVLRSALTSKRTGAPALVPSTS